jgi:hypothetical protein
MPKSVERFSGDIMLRFMGIDHFHEFEPIRLSLILIGKQLRIS